MIERCGQLEEVDETMPFHVQVVPFLAIGSLAVFQNCLLHMSCYKLSENGKRASGYVMGPREHIGAKKFFKKNFSKSSGSQLRE
jgi:hypothetical protein